MVNEKIVEAVKNARESPKRNFKQSFDLAINLRGIDLKKADNKIKTEVVVPHGFGRPVKIGLILDQLIPHAKNVPNSILIRKEEVEAYGRNKKALKALARDIHMFVTEAPLMPLIGKHLGQVLAVRNKMPRPIPTTGNISAVAETVSKTVRIALKDSPTIHCMLGTEDMEDNKIAENAESIINVVLSSLPKGKEQIKDYAIKLTMGKVVRFTL